MREIKNFLKIERLIRMRKNLKTLNRKISVYPALLINGRRVMSECFFPKLIGADEVMEWNNGGNGQDRDHISIRVIVK